MPVTLLFCLTRIKIMRQVKKKKTHPPIIYQAKTVEAIQPKAYKEVTFLTSAPTLAQCPPDAGWEIAFVGRSNAGKSSALNSLTSPRLARTSKTPGRTQLINFFQIDASRRLVDLPGYGYAKVPDAMRREWGQHLGDFLNLRQCLVGLVMLMDVRHPLTDYDLQLLEIASHRNLPVHLVLTKADKLKRGPAAQQLQLVKNAAHNLHGDFTVQLFSSLNGQGKEQAWQQLSTWLELA